VRSDALYRALSNIRRRAACAGSFPHTSFPRKRESTATRRSFVGDGRLSLTAGIHPDPASAFQDHEDMLPMVGEMVLVNVVISMNCEVTLATDQS
jgi:hypothetical protein